MQIDGYVTIAEAAKIFGRKIRTVRQWVSDKKLKAVKFHDWIWFIPKEEVERKLKELKK